MSAVQLDDATPRDDDTAERLIDHLRSHGAGRLAHAGGRSLLHHLIGTYEILRRWDQPAWLAHAGLLHSVYGTDAFPQRLLDPEARERLAALAGERAERLAYLFGVTPRGPLLAGMHRWAPGAVAAGGAARPDGPAPTREEYDALVVLHMANLAEQAAAVDGSPVPWLARLGELADLLHDAEAVSLPPSVAELTTMTADDEVAAQAGYRSGLTETGDLGARADRLAQASVACPVIGEPCIWLAELAWARADAVAAQRWARLGRRRLEAFGATWDKRLSFAEWIGVAESLERPDSVVSAAATGAVRDPRALARSGDDRSRGGRAPQRPAPASPRPQRFDRYLRQLADEDPLALQGLYPDLDSRPWFDPAEIALVGYLEANFRAIQAELLALEGRRFAPESERIGRRGDWDVAFLYERGRRRAEVCDACPVTTRGIEEHATIRTPGGLIYVSRMRGGTHIDAHRGPTNLRVRCHLGVRVPAGECAIRVGDEARHWTEGRCLVFDDHFEHEAWNHTGEDRIVLIADLWHPGLSAEEVQGLEGLHRYALAQARRLSRYWARNAAAAATAAPG